MEKTLESQFPLRASFLQALKNHPESDHESEVYRHIFSCMKAESLESMLENLKENVGEEEWFYSFHKSMRQTDFFDDVYVHYTENVQTEGDLKRMGELRQVLPFYTDKGKIWADVVNTEEAKNLGLEKEMREFQSLKRKAKEMRSRSISGHMDMILWNMIHSDRTNFLKPFMERFFKLQEIESINQ